jgi:hypothetical protein
MPDDDVNDMAELIGTPLNLGLNSLDDVNGEDENRMPIRLRALI